MLGQNAPTVDIVIVNWNTGTRLQACLKSIAIAGQQGYRLRRVIIVDNGSTDGSMDGVGDAYLSLPLLILRNGNNAGFARAANQGAAASDGELILFLNPDMILLRDTLTKSVRDLANSSKIGVVGIRLIGQDGMISRSCAYRPTAARLWAMVFGLHSLMPSRGLGLLMTEWDHADSRSVDHVIGAFYLIRRSVFERAGRFDERFFVYYEDLDLSLRVAKVGYEIRYVADASAIHEGGGSSKAVPAFRIFLSLQSRCRLAFKHFSRPTAIALLAGTLTIEVAIRLLVAFALGPRSNIRAVLSASQRLWAAAPDLLTESRRVPER